jgi:hypothetical protein
MISLSGCLQKAAGPTGIGRIGVVSQPDSLGFLDDFARFVRIALTDRKP